MRSELSFWKHIKHQRVMTLKTDKTGIITIPTYSDASNFRHASMVAGITIAENFQEDMLKEPIHVKELYAVLKLIKRLESMPYYKNVIINCDNTAVVSLLKKKLRGKSEKINNMLDQIFTIIDEQGITITYNWIATKMQRKFGADMASRNITDPRAKQVTFTDSGVKYIQKLIDIPPNIDVFSSKTANVFDIRFCSTDIDLNNSKQMVEEVFFDTIVKYNSRFSKKLAFLYPWTVFSI